MRLFSSIVTSLLLVGCFLFLTTAANAKNDKVYSSKNPELLVVRDLIYNGHFKQADKLLINYLKKDSKDPYAYLMRGILTDWKQVFEGKYGAHNKKVLKDFNQARMLAQVAYEDDRHSIGKRITLAHSLMYVSKKMIDLGQNLRAGGYLKRARDIMNYTKIHHPKNRDVDLTLGVFYYFSANVPQNLKWIASILGFSGSREKGLAFMKKASDHNSFSQHDAKFLLAYTLYEFEKNYPSSDAHLKTLIKKFPNNPEFRYRYFDSALKKKNYKLALQRLEDFKTFCKQSRCSKKYKFLMNYYFAESYFKTKNRQNGMKYAKLAIESAPNKERARVTKAHYWLASQYKKQNQDKEMCKHAGQIKKNQNQLPKIWKVSQKRFESCYL